MLIEAPTLVPVDGPPDAPLGEITVASLRLQGDRITAIGDLRPEAGEVVLPARGLVAIPGFVQTHVHYCQTLFRGLADDLPLMDWLRGRIWPFEASHDADSVRASARLSVLDLLRGGTTTAQVMETVRHAEVSFDVAADSGMTTVLGNCLMDLEGSGVPAGMATSSAEAMRLCEQLHAAYHGVGRLHYAISPRFILSCSDELSRNAAAFATQHRLRVHTHACEHPGELQEVRRRTGTDYILALAEQGLLGPRTGLAHCVHTTDAERRALVETGTAVLHCPSANLKLGSGVAPIAAYRALGLRIGLGADGAPCNNRLSALTELRQAALLQAVHTGPGAWPAAQALAAATTGGAAALGLDHELGSLTPGKRADLVLFDLSEHEPGGSEVSRLVYMATEADIRHVIAGGELVVRDGAMTAIDAGAVRAEARQQLRRLLG